MEISDRRSPGCDRSVSDMDGAVAGLASLRGLSGGL
jgi:hypothetical protein